MNNEQIVEALDESEKHWVNNEETFAKLDQSLGGSSAGFCVQIDWFEENCTSDKCALCDLFGENCRKDIIFCPLKDCFPGCCVEWNNLNDACYDGLATINLVRDVTTRIRTERAKFNQEVAKDKQP